MAVRSEKEIREKMKEHEMELEDLTRRQRNLEEDINYHYWQVQLLKWILKLEDPADGCLAEVKKSENMEGEK